MQCFRLNSVLGGLFTYWQKAFSTNRICLQSSDNMMLRQFSGNHRKCQFSNWIRAAELLFEWKRIFSGYVLLNYFPWIQAQLSHYFFSAWERMLPRVSSYASGKFIWYCSGSSAPRLYHAYLSKFVTIETRLSIICTILYVFSFAIHFWINSCCSGVNCFYYISA